jgi:hypothetical protein
MQLEAAIQNYVNTIGGGVIELFIYGTVILGFIALAKFVIVR